MFEREQKQLQRKKEAEEMRGKEKWTRSFKLPNEWQPISQDIKNKN